MLISDATISRLRIFNQHIGPPTFDRPHEVVSHMGYIQAQDYLGSLWAVGLRMKVASESIIEQALADRSIVRTWPARNTLHYVAAEDVRWMLDLLAPHAMQQRLGRYRQLELEPKTFHLSGRLLLNSLKSNGQLTRSDCYQVLEHGGISTAGQRGIHILQHLALEKLICFGPRQGKQQTFVLFDDWVPETKPKTREEALSELTLRFFSSHGPATVKDFAWWTGLTTADAKVGLENVSSALVEERLDDKVYWMPPSNRTSQITPMHTVLLPPFDEYLVGYADRSAVLDPKHILSTNAGGGMLSAVIVIDGKVAGTWKRTLKKNSVEITPSWFTPPTEEETRSFSVAAQRYATFIGLPAFVN